MLVSTASGRNQIELTIHLQTEYHIVKRLLVAVAAFLALVGCEKEKDCTDFRSDYRNMSSLTAEMYRLNCRNSANPLPFTSASDRSEDRKNYYDRGCYCFFGDI